MTREDSGHFTVVDPGARAGGRYWFRLDGDRLRPDPASRWQPDGPHEAVGVRRSVRVSVDRRRTQGAATGRASDLRNARRDLHGRRDVGGRRARAARAGPHRHHDDRGDADRRISRTLWLGLRRRRPVRARAHLRHARRSSRGFIDRAHALGLAVILDVVYNHLGPDGNYLSEFSPDYFTDKYTNDWGRAINFEGPAAGARALRPERALLDRGVSLRRIAAGRHAGREGCICPPRPCGHRERGSSRLVATGRSTSSRRTSRRRRGWSGRKPRVATARTRCGTTTRIMRRSWR